MKSKFKKHLIFIVLLCSLLTIAPISQASTYNFTTLDDPIAKAGSTVATGINDSGQITGYYENATGYLQGFLYNGSTYSTLDSLNTNVGHIIPRDINNSGQITGNYSNGNPSPYGFIYNQGTYSFIDVPPNGLITGINDSGQLTGWFQNNADAHGYIFDLNTNTYSTLDFLGGIPSGINNSKQVVGNFGEYDSITNSFTTISHPNASTTTFGNGGTFATGINDRGLVTGFYSYNGQAGHSFIYDGKTYTTFDDPSSIAQSVYSGGTYAQGINNIGQVVGYYLDSTGQSHGFLATPAAVPVPAAFWLFGTTITFMISFARNKLRS
ncbi:MAG: hypothetical protein WCP01_16675 [Methylococcaceae bacterium]